MMNGVRDWWKWTAGALVSLVLVTGGAAARPSVSEGRVQNIVDERVARIEAKLDDIDRDIDELSDQQARLEERIIALLNSTR